MQGQLLLKVGFRALGRRTAVSHAFCSLSSLQSGRGCSDNFHPTLPAKSEPTMMIQPPRTRFPCQINLHSPACCCCCVRALVFSLRYPYSSVGFCRFRRWLRHRHLLVLSLALSYHLLPLSTAFGMESLRPHGLANRAPNKSSADLEYVEYNSTRHRAAEKKESEAQQVTSIFVALSHVPSQLPTAPHGCH